MENFRFSMLLLEPGEIYFEDYSCKMTSPNSKDKPIEGSLKICSKSLVFEPRTWSKPLYKIQYRDTNQIELLEKDSQNIKDNSMYIKCSVYTEMLEDNIVAPFKFKYECREFILAFDFSSAESSLRFIKQLQRASTLHAAEHNSMIATISYSRYMRMVFDPMMMDDYNEEILMEIPADRITPLVKNPGKLVLTPLSLYFQPYNNIESTPVIKLKLKNMNRIYKRRFLLRQVGLEIYFKDGLNIPHIYLAFQNEVDRTILYDSLCNSTQVSLENTITEEITLQWQNGVISNYDYLLYLNCLADRSKNDLTQYPVFPWIISDYRTGSIDLNDPSVYRDLSKPMGALNKERLNKLMERYREMSEPKFIYGSHYSAPGLVLFYLVRKYPHYMLCLQNGRFDHPDRMFNSVADVYNNCLNNMSDFKELIPEFYNLEGKGDFLTNMYEINFGIRHDSTKVNHVKLPPWAKNPQDFVKVLRDALESEYVSRHLHLWIDLIFGYKQRGEEAVKAFNLYYHVCYEGSVDLETVYDMNEKHALEVQIMEFGQIPKQLFTKPHVRRIIDHIEKPITNETCQSSKVTNLNLFETVHLHKADIMALCLHSNRIISVGKEGSLKVYCIRSKKQIRSILLSTMPLSCCVTISQNVLAVGCWDNEIYVYDIEYGKSVGSFRAHDDSVSCLLWLEDESILISGGWDCVVRVWCKVSRETVQSTYRGLKAELDHEGKITCMTYRKTPKTELITSTSDGDIYIWNLGNRSLLSKVNLHKTSIKCLCYLPRGERLITTTLEGDLFVTDLTVKHTVFNKWQNDPIYSIVWDGNNMLWMGARNGVIKQWDIVTVVEISYNKIHNAEINSIIIDSKSGTLVTASDSFMSIWKFTEM